MTENEQNAFNAMISGALADLAEQKAPETDPRKDGVYYYAEVTSVGGSEVPSVSVYHIVVDHRVVAHVRIDSGSPVEIPELFAANMALQAGTTAHGIYITSIDGATVLPTGGITIKAPGGIYNRSLIKAYVVPRLARLLVRLYNLGV